MDVPKPRDPGLWSLALVSAPSLGVLVAQLYPTLCDPMDCSPPGSSVHGILQARILEWVAISFQGVFPTQGWNPGLPIAGNSLSAEPPGKPKNTEMGSLSLLQIFPTQESKWGLLHCRRILYHLNYQEAQDFQNLY